QEFAPIRTLTHLLTSSVMTDDAVGADFTLAVTLHTPAHLKRFRADDAIARVLVLVLPDPVDLRHRLDGTVTLLALHPGTYVPHVREVRVVGQIIDAHPRDGLLLAPVLGKLLHARAVSSDHRDATREVTARADLYRRNARVGRTV